MNRVKIFENHTNAKLNVYSIHCPGCDMSHQVRIDGPEPIWTFNGNMEDPTFHPSLLVNKSIAGSRCHSWVRDGMIQFLSDCDHSLAGQTVVLPILDDDGEPVE